MPPALPTAKERRFCSHIVITTPDWDEAVRKHCRDPFPADCSAISPLQSGDRELAGWCQADHRCQSRPEHQDRAIPILPPASAHWHLSPHYIISSNYLFLLSPVMHALHIRQTQLKRILLPEPVPPHKLQHTQLALMNFSQKAGTLLWAQIAAQFSPPMWCRKPV